MHPSLLSTEQTLAQFDSKPEGLTNLQAAQKLAQFGPNELPPPKGTPLWKELLAPFANLFVAVLLVAIVVSLFTDHLLDAAVIGVVIITNAMIEWYQLLTSKNVVAALKRYDAKEVLVRREGKVTSLPVNQLVPGDIIEISEGDKVPADGRLLHVSSLSVDESSLTGESLPIDKQVGTLKGNPKIYEQTNMVFKGTAVHAGRGELCVTATGRNTEFGKIADLTIEPDEKPLLQIKIDQLTRWVIGFTAVTGIITFGLGIARGYSPEEMVRFVLALSVSSVPEGLPVALTIVFLLGIQRMAQQKALVGRLPTIETLGMITAIVTDKTGTLTKNQLGVAEHWAPLGLNPSRAAVQTVSGRTQVVDPVDVAIAELGKKDPRLTEIDDLPFNQSARMSAVLWRGKAGQIAYVKGAPEAILGRSRIAAGVKKQVLEQMELMAGKGYRVIAVASLPIKNKADFHVKSLTGLQFEGLLALADGVRPEARQAVLQAQHAGIKVMMATGDYAATATTIAHQVHISANSSETVTGSDIDKIEISKLSGWLKNVRVLARVLPQNKYDVVQALRKHEIVAMTGDGVNDAPALVQADVGVAMGSGTDVAKSASDMILLNDSFATIITAIREGRTMYANVRKMVFYLFSTNLGEVLTMIAALLCGLPLPITAAQILWINLVTDGAVVLPLGLDPDEPHHMNQPPRKPNAPLLDTTMIVRIGLVAIAVAACAIGMMLWYGERDPAKAQTMVFLTIVVAQWANVFNARSERTSIFHRWKQPNLKLWLGLGVAAALQAGLMLEPFRSWFGLVEIGLSDLAMLVIPFAIILTTVEIHKLLSRRGR